MDNETPTWTSTIDYRPEEVQYTLVKADNGTLIGTIVRTTMIAQVTEPPRLRYLADIHNFGTTKKGYQPITLGVYADPVQATMDIVRRYEQYQEITKGSGE